MQSVASATVTPAAEHRPRVRVGRAGRELDPRQQRRHHSRVAQVGDVLGGRVRAVVAEAAPTSTREPRCPARAELVRVDAAASGRPKRPHVAPLAPGPRRRHLARRTRPSSAHAARRLRACPVTRSTYARRRRRTPAERRGRRGTSSRGDLPATRATAPRPRRSAIAALDLHRGGALRAHLGDQPRGRARAAPRRSQPGLPRPWYGCRPRSTGGPHPRRELLRSVTGEDQMGMAVDETRITAAPPTSSAARRPALCDRPHQATCPPRRRAPRHGPGRAAAIAEFGVVGDELSDAVTARASSLPHALAMATAARDRPRPGRRGWQRRPVADHLNDVVRPRGEHGLLRRRTAPAVGRVSRSIVTRSARAATSIRPASAEPRARHARSAYPAASSSEDRPVPALLGGQPLVELERAHLLEGVDDRMTVRSQRETGSRPPARRRARADAVAEVTLGGRAEAGMGPRSPEQRRCRGRLTWVACTALVRCPAPQHRRGAPSECRRMHAYTGLVLGDLFRQVDVQRPARCHWPTRTPPARSSRGTARTEWTAAPTTTPLCRAMRRAGLDSGPPCFASPSLKRRCTPCGARRRTAEEITRVQQCDPEPGLARGRDQRGTHGVRIVVRPTHPGRDGRSGTRRHW